MSLKRPLIIVAYPEAFGCQPKFIRKLDYLLSNQAEVELYALEDVRQWLPKYAEERKIPTSFRLIKSLSEVKLTHGIIFDDGESQNELIKSCHQMQLKIRLVSTPLTRVVNIDRKMAHDIYIGRGSPWGNPYAVGFGLSPGEEQDDREEAIRKFQYDFERNYLKSQKEDFHPLQGKILGCHCKPAHCHGDVIAEYLNSLDDGR
ncbi:MAG: DUF4326 domain-containing protein [Gammaproteobacteria bacterium]|nr:DUF4326 domain-containing protein [Gammaproteobacteria bacterium]